MPDRAERTRDRLRHGLREAGSRSFLGSLLGITAAVVVMLPFFTHSALAARSSRVVLVVFLIAAVWRLSATRVIPAVVTAVALLHTVAIWTRELTQSNVLVVSEQFLALAFLGVTVAFLTATLWREKTVGPTTIFLAIGLYLLIGLTWGTAFSLTELLAPGSFEGACRETGVIACEPQSGDFPRLYYFGFVTITTLGYGDIVPLTHQAEGLTTLATLTGQLFIAVLIGRLVGSYMADRAAQRDG